MQLSAEKELFFSFNISKEKLVSWAKIVANSCGFVGAALMSRPGLCHEAIPFVLFGVCHVLWAAASVATKDKAALSLNAALLPFDALALYSRM